MAGYVNATMDSLVIAAAGDTNPTNLTQYYTQITQLMYDNYTVAWLVVPQQYQAISYAVFCLKKNTHAHRDGCRTVGLPQRRTRPACCRAARCCLRNTRALPAPPPS